MRDLPAEIDEYRVAFLRHFPGLSWRDVDDMPFELWDACRRTVDQIEGR